MRFLVGEMFVECCAHRLCTGCESCAGAGIRRRVLYRCECSRECQHARLVFAMLGVHLRERRKGCSGGVRNVHKSWHHANVFVGDVQRQCVGEIAQALSAGRAALGVCDCFCGRAPRQMCEGANALVAFKQ